MFLQLLHLEGRAAVVHLQDPDEVGYGEHPHKPENANVEFSYTKSHNSAPSSPPQISVRLTTRP